MDERYICDSINALIAHPLGLRQDYASTSATVTRRSSSLSINTLRHSKMDLEEEDEEDEGCDQLPPPQPRLFRTGSMQRGSLPHSHTFSSIRDCRPNSSTPQYSLSGLSHYSGPSSLTAETHTAYRNSTGVCEILDFYLCSCVTAKIQFFFTIMNINRPNQATCCSAVQQMTHILDDLSMISD